jgi:hypothetical protein
MKTMLRTLIIAALAAFPAPLLAQTPSKSTQSSSTETGQSKAPNYYPMKVGTKWHYQLDAGNGQKVQLVSEIGGVDTINGKSLARLEVAANGKKLPTTEHLQSDDKGVYRVRMNNMEVTPPIQLIKYPLKEGQTWGGETSAAGQKMKVECSEGKPEEVQVPAGKYQAIPTTITVTQGLIKLKNVFWFAEDVGIIKQRSEIGPQTVTLELTKYEAGK